MDRDNRPKILLFVMAEENLLLTHFSKSLKKLQAESLYI
jgi:hypothetical protein